MNLIVDAPNVIHRLYHALPRTEECTWAVFGFINAMMDITKKYKPDELHLCFDSETSWRKRVLPSYKETRKEKEPHLIWQLQKTYDVFTRCGFATYMEEGFEADDLISVLVNKMDGQFCHILSSDHDLLQLVTDRVVQLRFTKKLGQHDIITLDKVIQEYGFHPKFLPDYYALVGEPGDNIKGCFGISPKRALPLIQLYSTLDRLYTFTPEPPNNLRPKLEASRHQVFTARNLIALPKDIEGFEVQFGNYDMDGFHKAAKVTQ